MLSEQPEFEDAFKVEAKRNYAMMGERTQLSCGCALIRFDACRRR